MSTGLLVSVVVPTYRRPALLARCLQTLLCQDLPASAYEVIVVDDAGDEATRRLVAYLARHETEIACPSPEMAGQAHTPAAQTPEGWAALHSVQQWSGAQAERQVPALRYLATAGQTGPAAARNLGWQAARGAVIAFTDDDCIPALDWLRHGLAPFANHQVMGSNGRVVVPLPEEPTDYERDATGLAHSRFVTANCFYRRQALQAVGGFDERFNQPWREDSDLFFRMIRCNYRLTDAPLAVVLHPIRPAPWGVSLWQQRKSLFNALIYKKDPQLYRQWLQAAPPWRYYITTLVLLGALLAALAGQALVVIGLGGLWLGLTLGFALQRLKDTSRAPGHVFEMLFTSALIPPLCVFWRLRGALKFGVFFL